MWCTRIVSLLYSVARAHSKHCLWDYTYVALLAPFATTTPARFCYFTAHAPQRTPVLRKKETFRKIAAKKLVFMNINDRFSLVDDMYRCVLSE